MGRSNKTHAFHLTRGQGGMKVLIHKWMDTSHKKGNFYIFGNRREEATYYNRFLFSIIVNPTKFQLFNSPNVPKSLI